MKKILTSLMIVASVYSFAQVSISAQADDTPQATLDVKAIGGATADGILVPRVDRDAAQNMANVEESTLIYISDVSNGTKAGQTEDVDATGFYYFKGGKWVKLGGDSSDSNRTIRAVQHITTGEWADGQYALIQTTTASVQLPPANMNNKNRIIAINNGASSPINYASPSPVNNSRIAAGKGQLLMCDGHNWYVIGGL